jgi:hypothetical protein
MVQQTMPELFAPFSDNQPQKFNRFDTDINFFSELLGGVGLGGLIHDVNWFAADGIPMMPVDDQGRSNAYPLVRVEAIERSSQDQLASTDIVLPVASEADCQTCHAPALDCASVSISPGFECDGTALARTADWKIMSIDGDADGVMPPGETELQLLLNTAKINILRLHDKKHGTELAFAHEAPDSCFAENEALYRLSKGHGGLMCQACHGSTHAIFPNPLGAANDNVASNQLQGHAGTIIECDTCHDQSTFEDSGDFELTMNGPHGMHAVGSYRWNKSHKEARTSGGLNCQACHGTTGDGTVLSRMATDRMLKCKDEKGLMCNSDGYALFPEGHEVGCADCHSKKF